MQSVRTEITHILPNLSLSLIRNS